MTRPVQTALALRPVGGPSRARPAPAPDAELDALLVAAPDARPFGERADAWPRVLARSGAWRVIRCRSDLQWIVQQRRAAEQWEARAYVYASAALPRVLRRPSLGIPPSDATALARAASALTDNRQQERTT